MKSFAIIRADNHLKVHTTLLDLRRYGRMVFSEPPKSISPDYADEILGKVMKRPLKNKCYAAALVSLNTSPSVAIGKLTKIHPPAHVVIVSSQHEVFEELGKNINILPEFSQRDNEMQENNKKKNQEIAAYY